LNIKRDGTIAQLVEQRTFNPFVVGSTPAGPTKNLKKDLEKSKSFFHFRIEIIFLSSAVEIRLMLCKQIEQCKKTTGRRGSFWGIGP
jgi:hypothetical protein